MTLRVLLIIGLVVALSLPRLVGAQAILVLPANDQRSNQAGSLPESAGPITEQQADPFAGWHPAADTQYIATGIPKLSTPYPNPATGEVRIDYSAGKQEYGVALLRLYDFLGKEIKTLSLKKGSGSIMLDINNLQPGIYFYSLEIDKKIVSTKRLVVSR